MTDVAPDQVSLARPDAPGRLAAGDPVAIIDIGSNSVRLVAYEGLNRAPTPIFNDRVLCGLGRGVATTGRLPQDGIDRALLALERFAVLSKAMRVKELYAIATAAARDAENGPEFLERATRAIDVPIQLLSGRREAELAALGVISGIYKPDGVVGDLGGGSLELSDVKGQKLGRGETLPLGGLSLMDVSGRSPKKAAKIVREALHDAKPLEHLRGRTFYAVGGTWRALAKIHMRQRNYPLNVLHAYAMSAREAAEFGRLVERVDAESLIAVAAVSAQRRPLLAYGALVLDEIIRHARPKEVVISASGVREGLLYEKLNPEARQLDALIVASRQLNLLRSRAPQHGEDLCLWTDDFIASTHLEESPEDRRLRRAACLLADIGWRAHPDYRGEQALNTIANANFIEIDHPGRAFLALTTLFRHLGPDEDANPQILTLLSARMLDRAHILGAAFRVGYVISAAMPAILPRTPLRCTKSKLVLTLPRDLASLANERLDARLRQLARLIGREPQVVIAA